MILIYYAPMLIKVVVVEELFKELPQLKQSVTSQFAETLNKLEEDYHGRYNALKRQYCEITAIIDQNQDLSEDIAQRLMDLIMLKAADFRHEFDAVIAQSKPEDEVGLAKRWLSWFTGTASKTPSTIETPIRPQILDDIAFWKKLQEDYQAHAGYSKVEKEIKAHVVKLLGSLLRNQVKSTVKAVQNTLRNRALDRSNHAFGERRVKEENAAWKALFHDMQDHLEKEFDNTRYADQNFHSPF
jgi:hypothetical protein